MSASAPVPAPIPSTSSLAKIFSSPLDDRIAHLNRVLSTASGIDSTLCFVGYGLSFVSVSLNNLRTSQTFRKIIAQDGKGTATGVAAKLADAAASAKAAGTMFTDFRTAMRLWGLLRIWAGAKATYLNPPKDGVLKLLAWSQMGSMAAYLAFENTYYLMSKGVLKGTPEVMGRRIKAALWVFLAYLVLDFVRLGRVVQVRAADKQKAKSEDVDEKALKAQLADQDRAWYRSLQVDLAYFILTWGWTGTISLPEWSYGLGGMIAGYANFKEALRVTKA